MIDRLSKTSVVYTSRPVKFIRRWYIVPHFGIIASVQVQYEASSYLYRVVSCQQHIEVDKTKSYPPRVSSCHCNLKYTILRLG